MKKIITCILFAYTFNVFASNPIVNIPDANFKAALISKGVDTNNDKEIQVSEAEAIKNLGVNSKSISDLTGIEAFINLTELACSGNQLTSLDVTQNTALTKLICSRNQLTSLDVTQNTALTYLDCNINQLTSLDVSKNILLSEFSCFNNQLTNLDVTQNTALTRLDCNVNQITTICVNANQDKSTWNKDAITQYSTTCDIITSTESQINNTTTIIKAYNLQGREVPTNTTGELIILLYDNGKTEKVFND